MFSVDGVTPFNGNDSYSQFSTGRSNGDGEQASHWKSGTGYFDQDNCFVTSPKQIGILDPSSGSGSCQLGIVTANDLAAFDAMGYNLDFDIMANKGYEFTSADILRLAGTAGVPEPATWAMRVRNRRVRFAA